MNNNNYILALLSTEGKFSCLKSAGNIEKVSHDKLTRFLSFLDQKPEINIKNLPKGGKIIIDDTSLSKIYAKSIEGMSYCSSCQTRQEIHHYKS